MHDEGEVVEVIEKKEPLELEPGGPDAKCRILGAHPSRQNDHAAGAAGIVAVRSVRADGSTLAAEAAKR